MLEVASASTFGTSAGGRGGSAAWTGDGARSTGRPGGPVNQAKRSPFRPMAPGAGAAAGAAEADVAVTSSAASAVHTPRDLMTSAGEGTGAGAGLDEAEASEKVAGEFACWG